MHNIIVTNSDTIVFQLETSASCCRKILIRLQKLRLIFWISNNQLIRQILHCGIRPSDSSRTGKISVNGITIFITEWRNIYRQSHRTKIVGYILYPEKGDGVLIGCIEERIARTDIDNRIATFYYLLRGIEVPHHEMTIELRRASSSRMIS